MLSISLRAISSAAIVAGLCHVFGAAAGAQTVMITEFMASNESTHYDGDGNASDWIELHNFGTVPVNLNGWHLTDRANAPTQWRFPEVALPAGGYLVVYASNQDRDDYVDGGGRLHTNFSLAASGEYLGLIKPDGVTVANAFAPRFPPQVRGISYGVAADGTIIGFFNSPTPGAANPASPSAAGPLISGVTETLEPPPADGEDFVIRAQIDPFVSPVESVILHYRVMFGAEQSVPMTPLGGGQYAATIPHAASGPGQMVRWAVTAQDSLGQSRQEPPYLSSTNSPRYFGTVIDNPATASPLPAVQWFVASPGAASTLNGTRCAVHFDGEFYDNVFVRLRGASSVNWAKKAYKFEFNTGHHFRYADSAPRVEEINLNTTQQEKSYVRESLTYETYRAVGVPASDAFPVRVEQNGQFFSVATLVQQVDEEFLAARDLDPEGALYKMFNGITSTSGTEKKTRLDEGTADLQALIAGLRISNPNRKAYLFDHVDLPSAINYFTCAIVTQDFDRFAKNYYIYRDTNGSGEWTQLPWDKDLTFGERFISDDISGDGFLDEAPDDPASNAHPFWCATGHARHGVNMMVDAVIAHPAAREMYLRRLRTLMDELLQPPGTPVAQLKFEARLDHLYPLLQIDAAKDLAKWGSAVIPEQPAKQDLAAAMNLIKTKYLAERRVFLYERHGLGVIGDGVPSTLVSGTTGATVSRYMVPNDNQLGLSWTAKEFDDAAWATGATGLGFELIPSTHTPLIATRVRPSETHPASTSIFLRIRFDIADLATLDALELRMKYDDGFVAYLNGTEIARKNVAGAAGSAVSFDHGATSRPDAQAIVFQSIDVSAYSSVLVPGENVLAIHALNSSALNSDMLVLPELAELPKPARPGSVGIPGAQPPGLPLAIGAIEFNPASGNQDQEFVQILNPNLIALDVSGWTVEGAIEHTFKPGTVIPSNAHNVPLYLSPHVRSFRARPSAPTGNSQVFVQGNYRGQLSARGETITIRDRAGHIAASTTYAGVPTQAQRFLRLTEIHYHPANPSAAEIAAGYTDAEDFEFVEIKNVGPDSIDIGGMRFDDGVSFVVPAGTMLAPGELAVIVVNTNAFATRYGAGPRVLGPYTGRLNNDGETLQLQDAAGENILKFTYNDRWYPATDGGGYALVFLDENADWSRWDFAANWGIGYPLHGSPGIQNSPVIRQQYAGWLNHYFSEPEILDPLISNPAADPNGDGHPNFYHYAFGSDPKSPAAHTDPLRVAINGDFLELTHPQRASALDLEFVTETSADLQAWTPVDAPIIHTAAADLNAMVIVTRRDPRAIGTVPVESRRFHRIRAIEKP
ncbi:MAG: lamin tail domain-containing protein [Verrucomicrobiales bacterium]